VQYQIYFEITNFNFGQKYSTIGICFHVQILILRVKAMHFLVVHFFLFSVLALHSEQSFVC